LEGQTDMDRRIGVLLLLAFALPSATPPSNTTRATLDNGLRVVIVRDPLAPVVTVEENYLAGGDETPSGFPGMAHAQEHMAFRGCGGVSADQIAAIYAQLGGRNNADTQQNITQYFATIPADNLDVVLRLDAACMQHIDDSQTQWDQERGAIEQEVARDLSNPTYKFLTRVNTDLFADTPYAHDALGTKESFDKTTAEMLQKFYHEWYAPNNAILVITGNVDPAATIAKVKQFYGSIPRHATPARPAVKLQPVNVESFTMPSNLPYQLVFLAYRMPGTDSPDYAAARVLSDVLSSERANLFELTANGTALGTEFALAEEYPEASAAFAVAAIPNSADSGALIGKLKAIDADYVAKGLPAELVEASKRLEVASAEFERNSIEGLAGAWSEALASEHRNSPEEDIDAIRKVTVADVNRVAHQYLKNENAVTAVLKPSASGEAASTKGFGGAESVTVAPTKPVVLPEWAEASLKSLPVPRWDLKPADMKLPNGIRLIVQTETMSPTVIVLGEIHHEADLETPAGQEGVSDILDGLFSYGTKTLDRIALRKALDDIAGNESAGANFSLRVLKSNFARGMELLAENELNPALPQDAFQIVKQQTAQYVAGRMQSPEYKASRAMLMGLVPAGDPDLREATPKSIGNVTLDDVHSYYNSTFRPDLTTIVVVGDVTPEEARAQVEKYFGAWKASGPKPDVTLPPVKPNLPSAVHVPDPEAVQDSVALAEMIDINRFSPDYYAIQTGNHVLGGGFYATRLYHDLRQTAGLVYNVDDSLSATKTRATYAVTYGCDPANVEKARAIVIRDLTSMQKENVTPGELEQAKALLIRQIPLSESSADAVGGGLLGRAVIGLPLDEPLTAAQRYRDMTADQVRAAFAKWVRVGDFVQVVRGPMPK